MAASPILRVLLLAVAVTAASALPVLPLVKTLPSTCGGTIQVKAGDTCQSLADYSGMTLSDWQALNPLAVCGVVPLQPGSQWCAGDKLAFCNNIYYSSDGDTCSSISSDIGRVLGIETSVNCGGALPANTPVCITDSPNACNVGSIAGLSISSGLQGLLASVPDYCSLVLDSGAQLASSTVSGIPALKLTLTSITTTASDLLGNAGHPELAAFQGHLADGSASALIYTFVPGFSSDGTDMISFQFYQGSPGTPSPSTAGGRKLLGGVWTSNYYGGTKVGPPPRANW